MTDSQKSVEPPNRDMILEAFTNCAAELNGLTTEEIIRVLAALCILFREVDE